MDKEEENNKLSKVKELREKFAKNEIDIEDIPYDVLCLLFKIAVFKIYDLENGGKYDECDSKDMLCYREFIVDNLFASLEELVILMNYQGGIL